MKFIIDMNLGPEWADCLEGAGFDAVHWSTVGRPDASDLDIMRSARENGRIVLTNDLDFGAGLAIHGDDGPSVVQLRTDSTLPSRVARIVLYALRQADADLRSGALLTVEGGGRAFEDSLSVRALVKTERIAACSLSNDATSRRYRASISGC